VNILHLSGANSWRGGEQQLLYLHDALKKQNVTQIVVCPLNSELYNRLKNRNKEQLIGYKKSSSLNLSFALRLKKICIQHKVDIIHVHDAHAHTRAFLSAWIFGNKTPVIVSRRVDFPIGKSWFSKLKYNHKSIRQIICVSEAIKVIMAADIKNKQVLTVVHDGIDADRFPFKSKTHKLRPLLKLSEDAIVIGNTSAIAPHKDYFTFADTASVILKTLPQAYFVIIGSGPLEQEIKDYIKQKGLVENITLMGFRNDVPELLPDFDIFLMTSKTEGLGTSILDAYACNVPVVATIAGGIIEIVEAGITGLLAEVGHAEQLAQQVIFILNDDALRKEIIKNASEKVKSFTVEQMSDKTMVIYKKMNSPVE